MRDKSERMAKIIRVVVLCLLLVYAGSPLTYTLKDDFILQQKEERNFDVFFLSKVLETAKVAIKAVHFQTEAGWKKSETDDHSFFIKKKRAITRINMLMQLICIQAALLTSFVLVLNLHLIFNTCVSRWTREIIPFTGAAGYRHCCSGIAPPVAFLS